MELMIGNPNQLLHKYHVSGTIIHSPLCPCDNNCASHPECTCLNCIGDCFYSCECEDYYEEDDFDFTLVIARDEAQSEQDIEKILLEHFEDTYNEPWFSSPPAIVDLGEEAIDTMLRRLGYAMLIEDQAA